MIFCGMLALCRMILWAVVDLFRPRAALEAEILVLRQQLVVLRRGKPGRLPFSVIDRMLLGWFVTCVRKPAVRSPSFDPTPWFGGIAQVCDVTGALSRGVVGVIPVCRPRSGN